MFETGDQIIYVIMGFGDVSFDNANKGVVLGNSYYSSLWCVEISIDFHSGKAQLAIPGFTCSKTV